MKHNKIKKSQNTIHGINSYMIGILLSSGSQLKQRNIGIDRPFSHYENIQIIKF